MTIQFDNEALEAELALDAEEAGKAADASGQIDDSDTGADDDTKAADAAAVLEASSKGWVPKDKYKGDATKWVDAATFLDRGKKFNSNLQNELAAVKADLERFKASADAFKSFHKEAMTAKEAEIDAAVVELRKQKSAAVREGDDDAVILIEDRIDSLKADKDKLKADITAADAPPDPTQTPIMQAWIADGNEWFRDDAKLMSYATLVGQELKAKGEKSTGREFLDKVTAIMKEEFPAKFSKRSRPGMVEAGGAANVPAAGKTAKDLPPEDRVLMKQFIAQGWLTEAEYLKQYSWPTR